MDFWSLAPLRWQDLIDILLLSFLFYRILLLIKGTRTIPMLMGMIILLVLYLVARFLQLDATGLLMDNLANSLVLVLVVLFQADIRNALAQFGLITLFGITELNSKMLQKEFLQPAGPWLDARLVLWLFLRRKSGSGILLTVVHQSMDLSAKAFY